MSGPRSNVCNAPPLWVLLWEEILRTVIRAFDIEASFRHRKLWRVLVFLTFGRGGAPSHSQSEEVALGVNGIPIFICSSSFGSHWLLTFRADGWLSFFVEGHRMAFTEPLAYPPRLDQYVWYRTIPGIRGSKTHGSERFRTEKDVRLFK